MMARPSRRLVPVLVAWAAVSCVVPTDGENDLQVILAAIPDLLLSDSLRLSAEVVDGEGTAVRHAVVAYTSSDPTIFSVDSTGLLRALTPGSATLTVTAIEFEDADPFIQAIRVRGRLEVDSVLPREVRFGELIAIYGVGLDSASIIAIQVGGVDAVASSFVPADTLKPQGEGVLRVWVPPPAARRSTVNVIGFAGVVLHPETLIVQQRDLYEPNDTAPPHLGPIPFGFRNPALAFERKVREEGVAVADRQPADWYTFENTTTQDRTIIFFSENVGAQSFGVFLTDSLRWRPLLNTYDVGPDSWTIGLETYLCGGLGLTRNGEPAGIKEVLFPFSILALKDLPAGTYHILAPYFASGQPASYELLIASAYLSLLPPDAAEENDYCDLAKPLTAGATANLTIDNPHDIDWFSISNPGGVARPFTVSVSTSTEDADLDLYLVADFRPDSLVILDVAADAGKTETITGMLPPGDYFVIVVDFPGVPAEYTMTTTVGVGAGAGALLSDAAVGARAGVDERLARLRAKRAAFGPSRPAALKPRPRQ